MFPINFKITLNNELLTTRMERRVRQVMKPALKAGLKMWYGKFLKRHFTDAAYSLYPEEYANYKKKKKPMVVSGHLRQHVLHQSPRISGTSRKVSMKVGLGRPAKYEGRDLRNKVFARMRWMKKIDVPETYKEAEAGILKRGGYGAKLVKVFRALLKVINEKEKEIIAAQVKKYVVKEIRKRTGKKVVVRIR